MPTLLQDAANTTLRPETLRWNYVRCNNRKRWCKKPVKKGAKYLWWWMHQTRFRFWLRVRCRAYGSVQLTICDEEEQKKRVARWRCVRYTSYGSLGWTFVIRQHKETTSQIKVCAIYGMRFTRMNYLLWAKRTEMVQYNKICVIRGKHVCNHKCVRRRIITQTIAANKPCVLWVNAWWYTIVSDWWNHHRRVPRYGLCAMSLHTEQQHMYL